jgi:hypothetical protein
MHTSSVIGCKNDNARLPITELWQRFGKFSSLAPEHGIGMTPCQRNMPTVPMSPCSTAMDSGNHKAMRCYLRLLADLDMHDFLRGKGGQYELLHSVPRFLLAGTSYSYLQGYHM